MAVNLSIKNVPDALADKLRRRADANHRSLQGELMALLESALGPARPAREPNTDYAADAASRPAVASTEGERPTLRAILRQARAAGRDTGPSSVELLREARSERDQQLEKLLDTPDAYERARALLRTAGIGSRKTPKASITAAKSTAPQQITRGTARIGKRG